MTDKPAKDEMVEELWRTYLTTGEFGKERRQRRFLGYCLEPRAARIATHPFKELGAR